MMQFKKDTKAAAMKRAAQMIEAGYTQREIREQTHLAFRTIKAIKESPIVSSDRINTIKLLKECILFMVEIMELQGIAIPDETLSRIRDVCLEDTSVATHNYIKLLRDRQLKDE